MAIFLYYYLMQISAGALHGPPMPLSVWFFRECINDGWDKRWWPTTTSSSVMIQDESVKCPYSYQNYILNFILVLEALFEQTINLLPCHGQFYTITSIFISSSFRRSLLTSLKGNQKWWILSTCSNGTNSQMMSVLGKIYDVIFFTLKNCKYCNQTWNLWESSNYENSPYNLMYMER